MTATNKETQTGDRKEFALKNLPDEVTGRAREVWLAGLGALERLEEEGDKVFETLVQRGKRYEEARRDQIEDATESLREQQEAFTDDVTQRLDEATKSVEEAVSDTLSGALDQIGVPMRDEVRDLSRRVGQLSEKLEALSDMLDAQQTAGEPRVFHVAPNDEGWIVTVEGEDEPASEHGTKKEAVERAALTASFFVPYSLTGSSSPSTVMIHPSSLGAT
jgi:poly(hydroxyalkanoate) granule-associated protein